MINLKQFYLNLVSNFIGEYVDNLSEKLTIVEGFKGKFKVENLLLKHTALDNISRDIGIPLSLSFGVIKKIELEVDWDSIFSSPCCIYVSDVHLLVSPVHSYSEAYLKDRLCLNLNKKIDDWFKTLIKNMSIEMLNITEKDFIANSSYCGYKKEIFKK